MHLEAINGAVFLVGTPALVAGAGGVHFTRVTTFRTVQQRVSIVLFATASLHVARIWQLHRACLVVRRASAPFKRTLPSAPIAASVPVVMTTLALVAPTLRRTLPVSRRGANLI